MDTEYFKIDQPTAHKPSTEIITTENYVGIMHEKTVYRYDN